MEPVVQPHNSTMAHKNRKKYRMVIVKSKLNILAYKPELQKTDLSYFYEHDKNSHAGCVLICHNIRIHGSLLTLLFKGNFQNNLLIFQKCHFFLIL